MSLHGHLKKMESSAPISPNMNSKRHSSILLRVYQILSVLSAAFLIGSAFVIADYKLSILPWRSIVLVSSPKPNTCEVQSRPAGTEGLPKGIVSQTSDLEMKPLWGSPKKKNQKSSKNLLAMAVGIKQKESVDKIVKKFSSSDFVVMLFHYDGVVNDWKDFQWSDRAIHVSAINQTKWWFAKRFLHPDIVSEYSYIFLWDEDLGVYHFNVQRYLSIIKEEGLEISQPALDPRKSELHHPITARERGSRVHRRINRVRKGIQCDNSSTGPPCTGFVEMMAPVFSRASWRCAWHMIQNDLFYGWGVDFQLGYCTQGDRTKNVGVVDSEYLVHYGLPTLGGQEATSSKNVSSDRNEVRKWSLIELEVFKNRWNKAAKEDDCWTDPYK